MSTCKLSLVGSLSENHNSSSTPHLPKSIVIHDEPDEIVTIGRENSKSKVNYVLGDSSKPRVVSRLHATLRYNGEDGSFSLTDQSVNGTYVNYVRVPLGGVKLETEDIVCFFHRNGANIKPGEKVEPFDTHLKYRVEFVDEAVDENDDIDDNDEEEEIDDGDNRANDTSEKASAAEDGGAKGAGRARRRGIQAPTQKRRADGGGHGNGGGGGAGTKRQHRQSAAGSRRRQASANNTAAAMASSGAVADSEELCAASSACLRPVGLAIDWVQCDHCSRWFHQMCIGVAAPIDPSKPFFCPSCK